MAVAELEEAREVAVVVAEEATNNSRTSSDRSQVVAVSDLVKIEREVAAVLLPSEHKPAALVKNIVTRHNKKKLSK